MSSGNVSRSTLRCSDCGREPILEFWQRGERLLCTDCRSKQHADASTGSRRRRLTRSALRAAAAAAVGFLLYAGATELAHGELPLLAPAIGWGVGRAVRSAAHGGNGRLERLLAAIATYLAIVCAALPALLPEIVSTFGAALGIVGGVETLFGWTLLVLAAPLLGGFENVLGLALLAASLVVAWRAASAKPIELRGPFTLDAGTTG